MTGFYNDSIFWVEVDKINPNPYQPRKEFNDQELQSLADSIRQYGVLQALVVTRSEQPKEDGGLQVTYELISGERRLRASKLAGVKQVPVIIRTGEESQEMKLELAIIENIQREDLNVVDRARAFQRLIDEFEFSHAQVAQKVGKSREYISNNLRVLSLPEDILDNLSNGKLSEGHARPLMMLGDKPEEQATLHKEIIYKKMSVREAERVARKIAHDKTRKKGSHDPQVAALEQQFSQSLGTRVHIEKRDQGGKLTIDYFSDDDLQNLLDIFKQHGGSKSPTEMMERFIQAKQQEQQAAGDSGQSSQAEPETQSPPAEEPVSQAPTEPQTPSPEESETEETFQSVQEANQENMSELSREEQPQTPSTEFSNNQPQTSPAPVESVQQMENDASKHEGGESNAESESGEEDDLYSVRNFSL